MAKKSIETLLVESAIEKNSRGRNRASFLAQKNEIGEALAQGWAVKDVWRVLHADESFTGSYDAFLRYTKQYFSQPEKKEKKEIKPAPEKKKKEPTATTHFVYDPTHKFDLNSL